MRVRITFVGLLAAALVLSATSVAIATFPGNDGEIAFTSYTGPAAGRSLRTVHADGSPGRVLFPSGGGLIAADADWSPDGSTVAAHVFGGSERIVLLDVDSGDRSLVIRTSDMPGQPAVYSVAFAPSGDALVVCASEGPSTRLYTMGTDGSDVTLVSDKPDCYADWSSTDRLVATRGNAFHNVQRIVTMDPDGSNVQVAVESPGDGLGEGIAVAPSWSPDGSHFVYSSQRGNRGQFDLSLVEGDGNGGERLTRTRRRSEYAPLFSPDAMRVAYVRASGRLFSAASISDLFSFAVDGTDRDRLTDTPGRNELTRTWQALSP